MPSSTDLVPTGLPYGARQENVAARQSGGVPVSSTAQPPAQGFAAGAGQTSPVAPQRPFDILQQVTPDQLPNLTQPGIAGTPQPVQQLEDRLTQSPSAFMRAVGQRMNLLRTRR